MARRIDPHRHVLGKRIRLFSDPLPSSLRLLNTFKPIRCTGSSEE
jgi:hypothetical protein